MCGFLYDVLYMYYTEFLYYSGVEIDKMCNTCTRNWRNVVIILS